MGGFNTAVPQPTPAALDIRPPQVEDPLAAVMNYRAQQQQRQLGALEIQGRQLDIQQRQAINQAYKDAFTPQADGTLALDRDKLTSALATSGHGAAIPGILENYTKYQQSLAGLQETNQKVAAAESDAAGNLAATVQAANNSPSLFHALFTDAVNRKILQPGHYAPIDKAITDSLAADPSGEQARGLVKQYTDQMLAGSPKQQELANQRKTAEGAAQRGQAAVENADREKNAAALKDAVSQLGTAATPADYSATLGRLSPELAAKMPAVGEIFDAQGKPIAAGVQRLRFIGMTPAEQQAATAAKPTNSVTEPELAERAAKGDQVAIAALRRLDQSRLNSRPIIQTGVPGLTPGAPGATSTLSGEEYLATLPKGTANQVRAIAEGRSTIPSATSRSQAAIQLRDAVFKYDPDFSEQRAQIRKAFTTGKDGTNIGNLNTAPVHLDQLADAVQAMGNGSFRPGNAIWNATRTMFGSSMPMNFDAVKAAVKSEMASALKGNATDQEIAQIGETIDAANSPQQLAGVVQENLKILGGKLNTYYERYQQQIPGDRVWNPILPSARAVFQKHGIDPTAGPQTNITGNGGQNNAAAKVPPRPSAIPAGAKAQYNAYRRQWRYSSDNGKTWQVIPAAQQ